MIKYYAASKMLEQYRRDIDVIESLFFLPKHFKYLKDRVPAEFLDIVIEVATLIDWDEGELKQREISKCSEKMYKFIFPLMQDIVDTRSDIQIIE